MPRRPKVALAILSGLLLSACSSLPAPLHEHRSPGITAQVRSLETVVRGGWHLPIKVEVFLSNAASGEPLSPGREAAEVELAAQQLAQIEIAYTTTAFDFFAVRLRLGASKPSAKLVGPDRMLEVRLPAPGHVGTRDGAIPSFGILTALAETYEWDAAGRWYRGEPKAELAKALGRDLKKLERLNGRLRAECRNLEHLSSGASRRAAQSDQAVLFTPSEIIFARATQFRAMLSLHRTLNTLGRWRPVLEDERFPLREEALTVLTRARVIHELYLSWMLQVLIGDSPAPDLEDTSFRHRNPLYKVLDARVPMNLVDLGEVSSGNGKEASTKGFLPKGAVRQLLKTRLDPSIRGLWDDIDDLVEDGFTPRADGPLGEEVTASFARSVAARPEIEERSVNYMSAWKQLWEARLKNAAVFPLYQSIASIARFLGDTRTTGREPAVSTAQLARLESQLRPGDLILVRQDEYLSNAFLPGFWPHAILYLGPEEAWTGLRLPSGAALRDDPVVQSILPRFREPEGDHPRRVIEAVSEGVVFSSLEHGVQKDYVLVLRPNLPEEQIALAIRRGVTLLDRPYDFDFDFATDDRIVCTELLYRAYDPVLNFRCAIDAPQGAIPTEDLPPGVLPVMGRLTMPANEIARYAIYMQTRPEPVAQIDYPGRRLEIIALYDRTEDTAASYEGDAALNKLQEMVDR